MTPLAHYLALQLTKPPKDRAPVWGANSEKLADTLANIHCFEVTDILPLMDQLVSSFSKIGIDAAGEVLSKFSFLPAPKTWIEYVHPLCGRIALLAEENQKGDEARVTFFHREAPQPLGTVDLMGDECFYLGGEMYFPDILVKTYGKELPKGLLGSVHGFLVLINTPRIVGRRQLLPHSGLAKKLDKFAGGKFPLHAWTEIKLEIAKPVEIDDGEPHESHLTGRRALHFCRKHIRIRNGKLEYVSAHWRGDASIGIRRSRYALSNGGAK